MSNILAFPAKPHSAATKRAQIEALARELGALVLWPDEAPSQPTLTARESTVLALMSERIPRSALSIAAELLIDRSWTCEVCRRLQGKGYAVRTKRGWVRIVTVPQSIAA